MKGVDYSSWQFWLDVAQIIALLVMAVYTHLANRSKANKGTIELLSDRVGKLEADVSHLPDHNDIGALHDKVNGVSNTVSTINGQLVAINHTLSLINEHLINGGR